MHFSVTDTKLESSYAVMKFSDCSQVDQVQDEIIRDMVELLSTQYGFEPLGRLKEYPAASCEMINYTYLLDRS